MDHEAHERGRRLREARIRAELTQSELAHRLSVASNTVSSWERGINQIPKAAKVALNQALGLPDASTWIWDGIEFQVKLAEGGSTIIEGTFRIVVHGDLQKTP